MNIEDRLARKIGSYGYLIYDGMNEKTNLFMAKGILNMKVKNKTLKQLIEEEILKGGSK